MPKGGTLLDYGIAINFFGNYRKESAMLNDSTAGITRGLMSLQRMIIGGGIVYALHSFASSLMNTALVMERNFASLKSTLGSSTAAIETLEWARRKGAETPFEIDEVNSAVTMMTTMGFNKNKKMLEDVFTAIGDFAGQRGAGFADIMGRVARASFGNWEALGDTFGIRKQTIGGMVKGQMARTPDKYRGEEEGIMKAIQLVEKGQAGTEEYKMSVVKLLGVLGRGGMINRLNTIGGAWGNVNDIVANFMNKLVGYSQMQGTLAGEIKDTIVNNILNPFMESHNVIINGIEEQITSVDQLGNIGKGVGDILIGVWSMFDHYVGESSNTIVQWIDNLDAWFRDYQNNVAPIILFLALVKLQIQDFLSSFYDGFTKTFGFFLKSAGAVWTGIINIADALGLLDATAGGLGSALGYVLGTLLGIRAFRLLTKPLAPLVTGAKMAAGWLSKVYKGQKAVLVMDGVIGKGTSGFKAFTSTLRYLMLPLQGAAASSWSFTASLLANPIGLIIIAVIALVGWIAYLVTNWDDVQRSMQGVSDTALTLLSIFLPIVGLPLLMAKHWEKFKTIFTNIWRIIKSSFNIVSMIIKDQVHQRLIEPIKQVIGFFNQMWTNIQNNYPNVAKFLKFMFAPILMVVDGVKWLINNGGNFLAGFLDKAGSWLGGVADSAEKTESDMEKAYKAKYANRFEKVSTPVSNTSSNDNSTNLTIPQVTIIQQPGQDGEGLATDFMDNLKNKLGKSGK